MITPLKSKTKPDYPWQSTSGRAHVFGRDYRSLLRSRGHLFRDGRWTEEDPQFHAYREIENPGLASAEEFSGGSYYQDFTVSTDQTVEKYRWRPAVSRGFDVTDISGTYNTFLPEPVEPDYGDYILGLNAEGTKFIRRYRPGNPVAHLGQFIGELHDLPRLPIFMKQRAKKFKDLGSEYLNIEFGWKPFVDDLIGVYKLQQTIRSRLDKLIANNGLSVKRRSKHEVSITDDGIVEGELSRPFGDLSDPSIGGDIALEGYRVNGPVPFAYFDSDMTGSCEYAYGTVIEEDTWFVGTFQYYVPDIGSDRWTEKAKKVLFGINPTPSLLYELYPWTWLVDWFSNVGDIMSNFSGNAVDNEVLRNAFVMKKVSTRFSIRARPTWNDFERLNETFNTFATIPAGSAAVQYSLVKVNKLRQQASPFGFGLKTGDFTLRQLAILAALAISRQSH